MLYRKGGPPGERSVDRAAGLWTFADLRAEHWAVEHALTSLGAHLVVRLIRRVGVEVVAAGEHVVSDASQGKDVGLDAHARVQRLFRGGVAHRSEPDPREGTPEAHRAR